MPVVVTGASGLVGGRAVAALGRLSPQVRGYVRHPGAAEPLRRAGAKVAVGRIDDAETLATVMSGAHTVCHLVGSLNLPDEEAYRRVNLGSVEAVLRAAHLADVRRILFLSSPGADPGSPNPYLRFKARAEEAVRGSGLEHVIVRSTHVCGSGSLWLDTVARLARRRPGVVVGSGRQLVAPVFVDDVAAVLAAADDRDRVASGTWGLEGPDRVTGDEVAELVAGRRRRRLHVPPRVASALARAPGRTVSVPALELLAGESLADAADAAAEFGLILTGLREALARSLDG